MHLVTSDGVSLSASYVPSSSPTCFVLAHGFTGSWQRPALRRAASVFGEHGGVVSFDFRGHGQSDGRSTVGDLEIHDLEAAADWARSLGHTRIATVGFSMGASVAVRHAALIGGVCAVAAVSGPARWYYRGTTPMRRVHWVIERRTGRLFSRLVLKTRIAEDGWDPVPSAPHEIVEKISPAPLLVVHGDSDPYFPVDHAHQLFDAAAQPKELWLEPGFGHAENAASAQLLERIARWLLDPPLSADSAPAGTATFGTDPGFDPDLGA
jgi:pimeloyl-ACP methyl ester carboxylesterase